MTQTKTCMKCQQVMNFKQGVSKKSGKPYAGYFCSDRNCGHVEFVRNQQAPAQATPNNTGPLLEKLDRIARALEQIALRKNDSLEKAYDKSQGEEVPF